MKKIFITLAAMLGTMTAFAGGLVTNTNMSVAYLRSAAREGAIDIDGIYFNPAGTAFLANGIHASVGIQTAIQERNTETTYAPFALNNAYSGESTRFYKGKAFAPVIPMIRLAYNWDRWNLQAAFNVVGGGGKCKFNNGLGMFEQSLATGAYKTQLGYGLPDGAATYSLNAQLTGESYQFGLYLGTSYEIIKEHLAISLGIQGVYAYNRYTGGMTDMTVYVGGNPAATVPDVTISATQKGFGATPIIGIDYRLNEKFNISARWQFQTYVKMKTTADNSDAAKANESLAYFQDGVKFRSDIPGYLMTGLMYSPVTPLRLMASYRYFDEKHAKRETTGGLNKKNPGTHEACFGLEWDICKYLTFSCGYQSGFYNMSAEEMSEMDFQLNSYSVLGGFRININEHWNIDLGYMHSFYDKRTVTSQVPLTETASLPYTVKYSRKNDVVGIAVNLRY